MAVSVKTSLVINITIACCVMFVNFQQVSCDCSLSNDSECEVTAGIATCHGFPRDLPECVTRLQVLLDSAQTYETIRELSETPLPNLTAVEISTTDRDVHEQVLVRFQLTSRFFHHLPGLKELRLNSQAFVTFTADAFQGVTALTVLDFTRTRFLNLEMFLQSMASLQTAPVQKLVLKNVQLLHGRSSSPYMQEVDISAIVCPLAKTLRVLDLSHNDIQAVSFKEKLGENCVYWLDTLDLSYNLLTEFGGHSILTLSVLLFGVQSLHVDHQWSEHEAEESLWLDTEHTVTNLPQEPSSLQFFLHVSRWLDDLKEYCPTMKVDLLCVRSQLNGGLDVNNLLHLFKCMFPNENATSSADIHNVIKSRCSLSNCVSNFLLLVTLKEVHASHIGGRHSIFAGRSYSSRDHIDTLFCAKTSNLEICDLSHSKVRLLPIQKSYEAGDAGIQGLRNMRRFDLSYADIAVDINPHLFSDMPDLEELHIGGNTLMPSIEQPLSVDYLRNKPYLRLFNVSNTQLHGVEREAFAESPALRTLDVSRNVLTSDTFFFQVAGTNLSRIIASDNSITTVSPAMRAELDGLRDLGKLELDLSGNPLRCDCSSLEFLRWARRGEHIRLTPSGRHVCVNTDTDLFALDIDQLQRDCETWRATIFVVAITLLSVAVFLLLVCGIHKRWFIRHSLFTLQEKFHAWRNPETTDVAYQFDAFVLYSGELSDRRWVHEQLVQTMENVYGFKLCIHLRNFIGGEDILDNVEMAIRKSRKVIAVLSPNFARSSWCVDEIQMTRSFENQEKRRKLIVILLEDFPNVAADIPPAIQCILQSRTYLEWHTELRRKDMFWRRLKKALYTKNKNTGGAYNGGFEMISMD